MYKFELDNGCYEVSKDSDDSKKKNEEKSSESSKSEKGNNGNNGNNGNRSNNNGNRNNNNNNRNRGSRRLSDKGSDGHKLKKGEVYNVYMAQSLSYDKSRKYFDNIIEFHK